MPKVLSGSSAGAIITGMLGVSKPSEFTNLLNGQNFFSEAFHFRKLTEVSARVMAVWRDVKYLEKVFG